MSCLARATVAASLAVVTTIAAGAGSLGAAGVTRASISSSEFTGVACPGAKSCDAVGFYESRGNGYTLVARSAGAGWSAVPSASPHPPAGLFGVACVAVAACTSVGYLLGKGGAFHTLVERSSGGAFTAVPSANVAGAGTSSELLGVACVTTSFCAAVGVSTRASTATTLVERWDGPAWRIEKSPNPVRATNSQLAAVSCVTSSSCTAVGRTARTGGSDFTLVEHWDGARWSIVPSPDPAGSTYSVLSGVSCPNRLDCEAVGYTISRKGRGSPLVERWNGRTWSIVASPRANAAELSSVACAAANRCQASGFQTGSSRLDRAFGERWNGRAWSVVPTVSAPGAVSSELAGVACSSASDCTAVGVGGDRGLAERWDGSRWRAVKTPA
jgi:hypothetical protein